MSTIRGSTHVFREDKESVAVLEEIFLRKKDLGVFLFLSWG
jgi:hypothetical protein